MSRFFLTNLDKITEDRIFICGEDKNHIKNVLRLRCGETIIVSDGKKNDYLVEIVAFHSDSIETIIINQVENKSEPSVQVVLYQGLPKFDKMDTIIQKSVELGVYQIIPVLTQRSISKIHTEDVNKKLVRWNKISCEAAKQCGRGSIPEVLHPRTFSQAVSEVASQYAVIPYEKETTTKLRSFLLKVQTERIKKMSFFIGPEGGFSDEEIELAKKGKITPVTLGPRILRTETAGISVLSIIMYELEM